MSAMEYIDRPSDARKRDRVDVVIDEICHLRWETIGADEMMQVAKAYHYFSIQFRENLEIACRLYPNDGRLKRLFQGECDTDNLSPWPGVAVVGEKLDHDEFISRLLSFQAISREELLSEIGRIYLDRVRYLDDDTRAASIASYEDGGLSRVFRAILRARDWEGTGPRAFKFFLEKHVHFDDDGGHGALSRHLRANGEILPLWVAFRELLVAAVPKLAQTLTALPCAPSLGAHPASKNANLTVAGANTARARQMRNETIAVHGGFNVDPATRAVAVPIYQTAAYAFDNAEHGAALFNLEEEGFRYSRINNPTVDVLDRRLALLEGGLQGLSVSSGQAALHYAVLNLSRIGSNIVSVPQLYGTTHTLFAYLLPSLGIKVRFAKSDNPEDLGALIDADTSAVFCESIGNPAGNICDIEAIAASAHARGVPLIVDNTVATPILVRPIDYGADIVVHSLTKFMGGHGTTLGGAIIDSGKFPWEQHATRFPMFNERDESYHGLVYSEHFGPAAYIARCRSVYQRTTGAVLAPMSAFLLLQGIETLALRVERHVDNARRIAEFLRSDSRVEWINYVGFRDNPYHALAQKYLGGRACSLLTFGVRGGYAGGIRFYNGLGLVKRLVNFGDAKSLACHPASTTHRQMPPADQRKAGVTPEMIRMSVGIEHAVDIIADLDQALHLAQAGAAGIAVE
jgi:O-acetylhomoserine (thiol)-lyase